MRRGNSIVFKNIVPFGLLSLILMSPPYLYAVLIDPIIDPDFYLGVRRPETEWYALSLSEALLSYLVSAALVYGTFQELKGRRVGIIECLRRGFGLILPVLAIAIVLEIPTMIGFAALVIPGLVIMTLFWVAIPAAVVERTGFSAFKRSLELTKGYRWRIFGIIIGTTFVWIAVLAAVIILKSLIVSQLPSVQASVLYEAKASEIARWIGMSFNSALFAVVSAVSYHDLRVAKENADIEQLVAAFD